MRLTAIVIDDEPRARKIIANYIKRSGFDVEIIGEADNIVFGRKLIEKYVPDFLFLDINIHDNTGFDLLNSLSKPPAFELIFTTAYDEFALKAIKENAFDYLLKPLDPDDFQSTLYKVVKKRIIEKWRISSPELFKNNIELTGRKGKYLVSFSSIIRCTADGNYTRIITDQEEYLYSKTLKHVLSRFFPHDLMLRCHQSHAFNVMYFSHYSHEGNIVLKTGDEVAVSRSFKRFIQQSLIGK